MKRALLAAALAIAAPGLAFAADFETPITVPRGSQLAVTVQRTRSGTGVPAMTIAFHYRQEVRPNGQGYLVRQRMTSIDYPPGMPEAEKAQLEALTAPTADLSYETDESLTPVRISDWQGLLDKLGGAGTDERSRSVSAGVRQMLGRMTAETAASSLLREQQFPAAPQGTSLDLRKPVEQAIQVANPLGGGPVDGVYAIELESVDKAAGRAVIRIRSKLDPESATRSTRQAVEAMAAAMPSVRKPTAEELAAIRVDRSVECRHDMDMATGLALISDCTQTVSNVDQSLAVRTAVDRWVITQALVRAD